MIKLEVSKKTSKYTEEDLKPHESVAGVTFFIEKRKGAQPKYLVQDHTKHNMLTFPIGKVKFDQTIEEGLKCEMKEELGITLTKYNELFDFDYTYDFDGKKIDIKTHVFDLIQFTGTIRNMEPKKCKGLHWMTRDELIKSKRKLGTCVWAYFKYIDDLKAKKEKTK